MLMGDVRAEQLMRDIDPLIRESLSDEQESAIRVAAKHNPWDYHPIDLRISIPLPFGRFYLTIVGGRERRSKARRVLEHERHPLPSLGNIILFAIATVIGGLCSFGLLLGVADILAP